VGAAQFIYTITPDGTWQVGQNDFLTSPAAAQAMELLDADLDAFASGSASQPVGVKTSSLRPLDLPPLVTGNQDLLLKEQCDRPTDAPNDVNNDSCTTMIDHANRDMNHLTSSACTGPCMCPWLLHDDEHLGVIRAASDDFCTNHPQQGCSFTIKDTWDCQAGADNSCHNAKFYHCSKCPGYKACSG
jgi:hypothetical protein